MTYKEVKHKNVDIEKISYFKQILEEYYKNQVVTIGTLHKFKIDDVFWHYGTYLFCTGNNACIRLLRNNVVKNIRLEEVVEIKPYAPPPSKR